MRTLLVVAMLALSVTALTAVPTAAACPDPDNPCTPQPIDPLPDCTYTGKITSNPVRWAYCQLS